MTPTYYTLTPTDLALAEAIAQERNAPKLQAGVTNYRIFDGRSDHDTHLLGVKGEIAVARVTGGCVNRSVSLGGDNGTGDVLLPNGARVTVKTRSRRGWDFALLGLDWHEFRDHYGVLVWPAPATCPAETFELVGWIGRMEFPVVSHVVSYGYGQRRVVGQRQLRDMSDFVAWAQAAR